MDQISNNVLSVVTREKQGTFGQPSSTGIVVGKSTPAFGTSRY
jgi:hypothetical protein